jgi:hypothetical protein
MPVILAVQKAAVRRMEVMASPAKKFERCCLNEKAGHGGAHLRPQL